MVGRRTLTFLVATVVLAAASTIPALAAAPTQLDVRACSDPTDGSLVVTLRWSLPGGGGWSGEIRDLSGGVIDLYGDTAGPGGQRGRVTFDTAIAATAVGEVYVAGSSVTGGSDTDAAVPPWHRCGRGQLP
jgi:hypothetical protein